MADPNTCLHRVLSVSYEGICCVSCGTFPQEEHLKRYTYIFENGYLVVESRRDR